MDSNANNEPAEEAEEESPYFCPCCGKRLVDVKGYWGCLCLWGGRFPTPPMIEEFAV
jgi:hypothetical protein